MQPRLTREQEPLVQAQQRSDWRDHTQFTAIVVSAAIDGHEVPMRAALQRLMANQDTIAEHTTHLASLTGKAFNGEQLTQLLHDHIITAVNVVNNLARTIYPASALPADYDLERQYAENVTRPMREKMQVFIPVFEAAQVTRETAPEATQDELTLFGNRIDAAISHFFAEVTRSLHPSLHNRQSTAIYFEAESLTNQINRWYRKAVLIAYRLSSLTSGDRSLALRKFADLMFTHIEQLSAAALNYYFRRYPAWIEALDASNRHIELLADTIAVAIIN